MTGPGSRQCSQDRPVVRWQGAWPWQESVPLAARIQHPARHDLYQPDGLPAWRYPPFGTVAWAERRCRLWAQTWEFWRADRGLVATALLVISVIEYGRGTYDPRIRLFSHRGSTCARPAVARIRAGRLPTGAYWRVTGASISTSPARVRTLPLSAAWNASRLRRSRYGRLPPRRPDPRPRLRVCAPKQPSATAARSWIWAHRASTSPGGRPERDHLDQASMLSRGNSLTHPGQPPALPRCPHGGRSSPDAQVGGGVRQLDRIRKDVAR